jgi:hypothetical protein
VSSFVAIRTSRPNAKVLRLWTGTLRDGQDMSASDRSYLARVVAMRTGIPQADAQTRVNEVITEAKAAADRARRAGAQLAFWMTASLLLGAFSQRSKAVNCATALGTAGCSPRDHCRRTKPWVAEYCCGYSAFRSRSSCSWRFFARPQSDR